jgi:hypothetical protein
LFFAIVPAKSQEIFLPESELPSESVQPILDNSTAVINRILKKTKKINLGISIGSQIDEMFYNNKYLGIEVKYNSTEVSSWGIRIDQWFGGPTSYADSFATDASQLQFQVAPFKDLSIYSIYSWDLYYGKISLIKEKTNPIFFGWVAMAGVQRYASDFLPALQGGVDFRLYNEKNLALTIKYLIDAYQKYDPTSLNVRKSQGTPSPNSFQRKFAFGQVVEVGCSWLF